MVFERDCGATTSFSTQVSIIGAGEVLPNAAGNLFAADSSHGIVHEDSHGVMNVTVEWKSDTQVEISYPSGARAFLRAPEYRGIRVNYRAN